jgi:hypothetical protein
MSTIATLEPNVIKKVENRTTEAANVDRWIRDALVEIAGNSDYKDDFDELEVLGPTYNLTIGVQPYDFSNFLNPGDYNLGTLDFMIWIDPPNNTKRKQLMPTHYQDADKYLQAQSIPAEWFRFADQVLFTPPPNNTYQVQARILRQHPITDYENTSSQLSTTVILLPREWNEILEWAAAMRGFMELLEYEKAANIRQLLYGDPKHPEKPGLIEGVKKRRKREGFRQTVGLRPIIRSYGWGQS